MMTLVWFIILASPFWLPGLLIAVFLWKKFVAKHWVAWRRDRRRAIGVKAHAAYLKRVELGTDTNEDFSKFN